MITCNHALACFVLLGLTTASAQNGPRVAFEVASIRELPSIRTTGPTPSTLKVTEGRVDISSTTLPSLILQAFAIERFRVSWPEWLNESVLDQRRFEIHATIPAGVTRDRVPAMMQTLLRERFGLVAHVEPRPIPVYELVVQPGGSKMRRVDPADDLKAKFPALDDPKYVMDDVSEESTLSSDTQVRTVNGLENGRPSIRRVTKDSMYISRITERQTWDIEAVRITMGEFASLLGPRTDRPVFDKTGLGGLYQFRVELPNLTGIERVLQQAGITRDVNGNPIEILPSGVSIFKAVETLGLKLEPGRSPIDVLVVEKVERTPTAN